MTPYKMRWYDHHPTATTAIAVWLHFPQAMQRVIARCILTQLAVKRQRRKHRQSWLPLFRWMRPAYTTKRRVDRDAVVHLAMGQLAKAEEADLSEVTQFILTVKTYLDRVYTTTLPENDTELADILDHVRTRHQRWQP